MIAAVDLAVRYSAVVGMDADGYVLFEYDSLNSSLKSFLHSLAESSALSFIEYVILEDMPHGNSFVNNVKNACRMQGMVLAALLDKDAADKVVFVQPRAWQSHHKVTKGGKNAAKDAAAALGYEPPDLHSELHHKERQVARKVETDYVDAFLMARWALDQVNDNVEFDTIKSVDRFKVW